MPVTREEIGGEHRRRVPRHRGVEHGGSKGLEKSARSGLFRQTIRERKTLRIGRYDETAKGEKHVCILSVCPVPGHGIRNTAEYARKRLSLAYSSPALTIILRGYRSAFTSSLAQAETVLNSAICHFRTPPELLKRGGERESRRRFAVISTIVSPIWLLPPRKQNPKTRRVLGSISAMSLFAVHDVGSTFVDP